MNIVIVGGLLALVAVAIVGLILLGVDEERVEKQRKAESSAEPKQTFEHAVPQASAALPAATPASPAQVSQPQTLETSVVDSPTATRPSPTPDTPPSSSFGDHLQAARQATPPVSENEHFLASRSGQRLMPISYKEESAAILNQELHEITSDLRSLVQKASEMEQRLGRLSEILERQQQIQNSATPRTSIPGAEGRKDV